MLCKTNPMATVNICNVDILEKGISNTNKFINPVNVHRYTNDLARG